jgi:hypothetical protein
MSTELPPDSILPPGLLAEVQAAADEEHREPTELVREAVTRYLEQRRAHRGVAFEAKRSPAQAAARIRELRKGNLLPPGLTIEELIRFGRA